MRRRSLLVITACAALCVGSPTGPARAQFAHPPGAPVSALPPEPAVGATIEWRVRNRFRLFRSERDFERHVAAQRMRSVLAAEQALALETDGRGWAHAMITRLCVDSAGDVVETCVRDGVSESYLTPSDHLVEARLAGSIDPSALCSWAFADGDGKPRTLTAGCDEKVNLRVVYGRPTIAIVDIIANGKTSRATTEILVRDVLIAGLGDSIAAGEGNPDRPVKLADEGFCFRRFLGSDSSSFFRPSRAGYRGDRACAGSNDADWARWSRLAARWTSAPCHRSLYSYQLRAALTLAIENPRIAVTFLPLACTGATIDVGLFRSQRARELKCGAEGAASCPTRVPPQLDKLRELLAAARRGMPGRSLDLVFLTVGANDIDFSGLVANVIIKARAEWILFRRGGLISYVDDAQSALDTSLPADFSRMRAALKPLVNGRLDRVVYVSYANPALSPKGGSCPSSREGFDIHPAFGVDGERLREVVRFVDNRFFPRLKALATCSDGVLCNDPSRERMTFVDAHQPAFAHHGFCARAESDPVFDRECFSTAGESFFAGPVEGASKPLRCSLRPSDFRSYASRARWIRTANDSYFAAMTFPENVSLTLQPSSMHDATWGVLSAVYGGAVHPTAEGHAAMADAAVAAARGVLRLAQPGRAIVTKPLPALEAPAPPPEPLTAGTDDTPP